MEPPNQTPRAPMIDARRGVFFVLQPTGPEETKALEACAWRKHRRTWDKCACPLCHMRQRWACKDDDIGDAWWTLDATCAEATRLPLSPTAELLVDRARDTGRASNAGSCRNYFNLPGPCQLYGFQRAGVHYALNCFERGAGVLIADEMGLGKTAQAICTAMLCAAKRVLVVCPASLCLNWEKEIARWNASACVTQLKKAEDVFDGPGWAVTNPEMLISAQPRTAQTVVQRATPDEGGKSIRRYAKTAKPQDVVLWIGSGPTPDALNRLLEPPMDPCKAKCPSVIAAGTVGDAIMLAHKYPNNWTHVIHSRIEDLRERQRGGGMWKAIERSQGWDVLILDEAHRYANPKAAQTKRVLGEKKGRGKPIEGGLVQRSEHVIALTGTPISNRPREIAPLLQAVSPVFSNTSHFLMRYCGAQQKSIFIRGGRGKQKSVWDFDGSSNLPELQARLRRECMVRRLKKDVLHDLPAKMRQIIPLTSEGLQVTSHQERLAWVEDESVGELALGVLVAQACDNAYEFEASVQRLVAQATGMGAAQIARMRRELGLAKIPIAVEHIKNVLEGKAQLVVMAHHREVIEALVESLPDTVCVYGGICAEDRDRAVTKFQAGQARVFVGSLKAAGVGLTLTAADTMIFVEDDWVPATLEQAEARIHRIGQKSSVLFQHLIVEDTVDAMIVRTIISKQQVIDAAIDTAPAPSSPFPVATPKQRVACTEKIFQWIQEPNPPFVAKTMEMIRQIGGRIQQRPPTDGEVHLTLRLVSQAGRIS